MVHLELLAGSSRTVFCFIHLSLHLGGAHRLLEGFNTMFRFFQRFIAILVLGALSSGCGLIPVAEDVLAPLALFVSTAGNDANDCLGPEPERACLTLQAALDKSNLNTTIYIGPGHFRVSGDPETLEEPTYKLINGVTLSGAGQDLTILHSYKDVYLFGVDGPRHVTIRNLGIDAGGGATGGIDVNNQARLFVEYSRVFHGKIGVNIQGGGDVNFKNSLIDANTTGVQIYRNGNAYFDLSRIETNTTGVHIHHWGRADILGGTVSKNDLGIWNEGSLEISNTDIWNNTGTALRNGDSRDISHVTAIIIITLGDFRGNGLVDRTSFNPIIENTGDMKISDSTISYNYGTAISNNIYGDTRDLILDNVQIVGNESSGRLPCAISNTNGNLKVKFSNIESNECVGVDVYGGDVSISHSSIIDNNIGIFARGRSSVEVNTSTISANNGFGIEQVEDARLLLTFVTLAFNRGVGISSSDPDLHLVTQSTVIALNIDGDCNAAIVGRGDFVCNESWTRTSLGLGPLTETESGKWFHPLLPGSPLIDPPGGSCDGVYDGPAATPFHDQRGAIRPSGVTCDVGAYEFQISTAVAPLEFVTPSGGVPGVVPLYTATPQAPTPIILTFTKNAFCRKGPGTLYRDISGFQQGDTAQADGRNATDPRWWWVLIPNSTDHCWISYATVETNNLAEGLPVQTVSLGLPGTPASFAISARTCSKNGFLLKLVWNASAGAEGYTLYRNSKVIATFKANGTVYQDNPPMNKSLTYELEAFNSSGFSERLVVEDGGCK
jgi:hypothetical protein